MWSIAEEVARRWITSCTNHERGWVPRRGRESWLGLMWEVEVLRRGAVFGRSHEEITLSEDGALATTDDGGGWSVAASKPVMRAGRHYAQFTVVSDSGRRFFGVIRPTGLGRAESKAIRAANRAIHDGHCFYYTDDGTCFPGMLSWEGMQGAKEDGDRVGLLLDLDQGTMTVYKNDERVGVMATGLIGEYNWAVMLFLPGDSARIKTAEMPASSMQSS
jgi:hypothetical protein